MSGSRSLARSARAPTRCRSTERMSSFTSSITPTVFGSSRIPGRCHPRRRCREDSSPGRVPMATAQKEFIVRAPADGVWAAFRDVGAVHTRLARKFVTDCRLDGDSRIVTFADGTVVRERIVTIDEARRRLSYAVTEWRATHHNASFQVFDEGDGRTRIVWITDVLPNDLGGLIDGMMEQGAAAMKQTLEAADR